MQIQVSESNDINIYEDGVLIASTMQDSELVQEDDISNLLQYQAA